MNIPPWNLEIERIYYQIVRNDYKSLALVSTNAGEGITSLATALSQRSLLAGQRTLLVDLNLYHPSLNSQGLAAPPSDTRLLPDPELVGITGESYALTGITAPSKRESIMELRRPGTIEKYVADWKNEFDLVIFDTSPISRLNANNIPPERVAAAADGTIMVVMSGQTTESMASEAAKKLNDAGAHLLGCVLNDKTNPSLKTELLREIDRLSGRMPRVSNWLKNKIHTNRMLSMEI